METTIRLGSCLCGSVKYEVKGQPFSSVLCHCDNCAKASGSSFMANDWYKIDKFDVKSGQDVLRVYEDTATNTGQTLQRSFYGSYGSPLFIKNDNMKDFLIVMSGTTEDRGGKGWKPTKEYNCQKRLDWVPGVAETEKHFHMPTSVVS